MESRTDGAEWLADPTGRAGKVADGASVLAPPHQPSGQGTRKPGFFRPPPLSNHFSKL